MNDSSLPAIFGILVTLYFVFHIFAGYSQKPMVCKSCGTVGDGHTVTRGSLGIEIILWLCFILPGLIYSVWRHSSQFTGCDACGSREMIPVDSPIGKRIVEANAS
jgi:hypothetical protein